MRPCLKKNLSCYCNIFIAPLKRQNTNAHTSDYCHGSLFRGKIQMLLGLYLTFLLQLESSTVCRRTCCSFCSQGPHQHLTTASYSGSKGSDALFWFPQVPIQGTYMRTDTETCPQTKVIANISLKMVLYDIKAKWQNSG